MKPIISRLRKLNIEISLVAGKLRIHAPEGVLTGELLEEIKASKDYLIEYILEVRGNRPDTGIPPAEKKRYFRLTSAQRRLYTLYAMDRDSLAYNETQVIRLDGDFQEDKLRRVFRQLVQRHESLRTYFELVENEPVQRIAGAIEPAIGFLEGEESWLDRIIASFIRPFDLHRAPLFRAGLVTTSAGGHFLIVDTHHIITDAFSEGILIRDFRTLWKGESLDPLPLQYKDYAEWQGHMHRMKGIGQREFWLREFAGEPKPPELPADFPRPAVKGRTTGVLHFELQAAETAALRDIGRESGASLFMILLSIYTILLAKLSGQEDIVVGIPMADRQHAGLEGVMGLFINTLALRNYPRGDKGYLEFLSDLRTRTLACLDHPYYPYEDIIDDLRIARTTGRNPLFDVWFIYQNYEKAGQDGHGIVLLESRRAERESKFDIILEASDPGSQIFLTIVYSGDLFRQSTMERFAGYFREIVGAVAADRHILLSRIELLPQLRAVPPADHARLEEGLAPASYHQERLWFIHRFEAGYLYRGSPVYHNIPLVMELKGRWEPSLLEKSLSLIIGRHEVFRTAIVTLEERPFQKISATLVIQLEIEEGREKDDGLWIRDRIDRPFQLEGPLIRAHLLVRPGGFVLLLIVHHSIADRHTLVQLTRQMLENYMLLSEGREPHGRAGGLSYSTFSQAQQQLLPEVELRLMSFWRRQLGGRLKALELPTDRPRAAIHIYKGGLVAFTIGADTVKKFGTCVEEGKTQLLLMGCFILLLYKYCRHEEIVIGTSADNREGWDGVMGPLANLVVLRNFVNPEQSFDSFMSTLEATWSAAMLHQAMPFDKLVKELAPQKDMSRTALFDVLFQYEDGAPVFPIPAGAGLRVKEVNAGYGKYDLNLWLQRTGDVIEGRLVYNAEYLDSPTIRAMIKHYKSLLNAILARPDSRMYELSMIGEREQEKLLHCLDRTDVDYPKDKTITDLFVAQAARTPEHIAIKMGEETLTYRQLDSRSSALARLLREKGVTRNEVVGLLTGRSIETVLAMLAIMKAGGAYLPMDIDYPPERVDYLISDSGARLVLATREYQRQLREGVGVLFLEDEIPESRDAGPLMPINEPSDCCYVIYTSGTTGQPKGVMVEHRNVVRLFFNDDSLFSFDEGDVWTLFHSHCFDFSVWEMYGALLFGGRLVVIPRMLARDTHAFLELLAAEKVTVLNQTPSAFYNLALAEQSRCGEPLALRYVIFGGEALSPARLRDWKTRYPEVALINMYGITETTVHVTYKDVGEPEIAGNISNVGRPIPTLSVYLFDEYGRLVPRGIIGELYVGGAGVSRGYLGKEALTAKKFVPNPYRPLERLYRTGDLGRVLRTGEIEYIGRIDHQVQLRGYRIELGEIESHLNTFPGMQKSVVLAREKDGEAHLIAYVVYPGPPDMGRLRNYLSARLPDYMVPTYFIRMEEFPMTSNGKLDRDALPAPSMSAGPEYRAPADETEERLVQIWADVLRIDRSLISVNKSFFELGGHSLRAAIMVNRILKELGVEVQLREVFRLQTIAGLRQYIRESVSAGTGNIGKAPFREYYSQSFAQRRLYFLYSFDPSSLAYNLPQVLRITGEPDKAALAAAFHMLIQRHESLRTSFQVIGGLPVQKPMNEWTFRLEEFRCSAEEVPAIIESFIRPWDLAQPPLIRAALIELSAEEHFLLTDVHHIAADGISQNIMIRDLTRCYRKEQVPEPAVRYTDYAEWQSRQEKIFSNDVDRSFWINELADYPITDLPADHERPAVKDYMGGWLEFELTLEETQKLQRLADSEGVTLFMCILSVYTIFLAKVCNREDVVVGCPVAGRSHPGLEEVIGMFVNTLAFRNMPRGTLSCREYLAGVKQRTLACLEHQHYPYERLIEDLKVVRDTGRNPLFDVMLFFQNFEEEPLELPGLRIERSPFGFPVSKFDLTMIARPVGGTLHLTLEYATALFRPDTVGRFVQYFRRVAAAISEDPGIRISDIDIIGEEERRLLIDTFNPTVANYPAGDGILSLLARQVERTPDAIALVHRQESWTYRELYRWVGATAVHLREKGVQPGELVGLLLERNEHLLPSLLGILAAGAAYLPIDPGYPAERIRYMLEDSGIMRVVTEPSLTHVVQQVGDTGAIDVTTIDRTVPESAGMCSSAAATDLAYMIYTSGSTGNPKGVLIGQENVVNFVRGVTDRIPFIPGDVLLCVTTVSFDIFVLETIVPLLNGLTVVLAAKDEQRDPLTLCRMIVEKGVSCLQMTPSHLQLLLAASAGKGLPGSIRLLMVGGEAFPSGLLKTLQENHRCGIYNMYGPTETTVWSVIGDLTHADAVRLGKPMANTYIRITDSFQRLVPRGTAGELCIGGAGVSRGYWRRDALSEEKFIPDPAGTGERFYRTGDLARWEPDGVLCFLGRLDSQEKIRGYRIEPGEIEHQLKNMPGILETAVVARESNGIKQLVAYYTASQPVEQAGMRQYIADRLPEYMVPAYFIPLSAMPLTPNGKLNRKALPAPVMTAGEDYAPPSGHTEVSLVDMWAEVLKIDKTVIGVHKNFFELGGTSLHAMALMLEIRKAFDVQISLAKFFAKPTVHALGRSIQVTNLSMNVKSTRDKVTI